MKHIIEEARRTAAAVNEEKLKKMKADRLAVIEWQKTRAQEELERVFLELPNDILEAGRQGLHSTSVSVYNWASECPDWYYVYFKNPFETYLKEQGIAFEFKSSFRQGDAEMPGNASGWYEISWK